MSDRPTTMRDLAWLAASVLALAGSFAVLEAARAKGDTRRALARVIRRESTARDLVVVVDEAPELVAMVRPTPALWGVPPLDDLTGVQRLYVLAPRESSLGPFYARLGAAEPFHGDLRVRRWDIAAGHLSRVTWNALDALGDGVSARREGGVDNGPCPPDAGRLVCHGPPWNSLVAEAHHFDGVEQRCIFAHPQADGALIVDFANLPPARALVGTYGIDDGGYHPEGSPVDLRFEVLLEGAPPLVRTMAATNRKGLTPFRIDLPARPARATMRVTTANAGARQFCFTLLATE